MAAEKKGQTIVIKKIFVQAGHHGGSWKVALADFMTALMAFFLVMWLLNQSTSTKKAVSDYFSTPSVIEYSFQNFGVEITLEKLFLDLLNEPLKTFQTFLEPQDKTPNLFDFGSQKVVASFMADKVGDVAKNMSISPDGIEFDIPDFQLFKPGTAQPNDNYITVLGQLQTVTQGLSDSILMIDSRLFNESVSGSDSELAKKVAVERLDLIRTKLAATMEHSSNTIEGGTNVVPKKGFIEGQSERPAGMIHVRVRQKEVKSDGTKPRKLDRLFGASDPDMDVYDNFVKQLTKKPKKAAAKAPAAPAPEKQEDGPKETH